MKFKNVFILLVIGLASLTMSSCKKNRFSGEKDIMVGTWIWQYTVIQDHCSGFEQSNTLDPLTENTEYKMVFLKRGKVRMYKDDVLIREHNVKIDRMEVPEGGIVESNKEFTFYFFLDGKEYFFGSGTTKELRVSYFPYGLEQDCYSFVKNIFAKSN